jgi:glycosyltransferase involved in cell wall biosynthesis
MAEQKNNPITNAANIDVTMMEGKKFLNVSMWGWPIFGGGEQFLLDTMKWARRLGMDPYWICFEQPTPKGVVAFSKFNVIQTEDGTIMQIPGGYNETNISNWIRLINPDVVNHQGGRRRDVMRICHGLGIPCMTGICFWNEIIKLDHSTNNRDIIKHAKNHSMDPAFPDVLKWATTVYSASKFVTDAVFAITGVQVSDMIYSSSSVSKCRLFESEKVNQHYVTLINYHEQKGGRILLELIKRLPQIPFLCVKTEYKSEDLDRQIETAIDARNAQSVKDSNIAKCKYIARVDSVKDILRETKILLVTSLVDETFCRTCNEAMCNGIPVITTGKGNIEYMVGDAAPIVDQANIDQWVREVHDMYLHEQRYNYYSRRILQRYSEFSEEVAISQFSKTVHKTIFGNRQKNVMIFAPWGDQGLGIQARIYVNMLENIGFKTSIFSFKPYVATESNPRFQKNSAEWMHERVYYSDNSREDVTDDEIIWFIQRYKIGMLIIPEICFDRVFEVANLAKRYDVRVYAIPNIEICRRGELSRYDSFDKLLCNNHYCEEVLNNNGVFNTEYVSHCQVDDRVVFRRKEQIGADTTVKFLNLGGLNAITRKQCVKVCEAFRRAYVVNQKMHLTVVIQGHQIPEEIGKYVDLPGICIVISHLTYAQIMEMYHNNHICIQVSKHEGLGLGFYESLATGTPVVTLKAPLHSEVVNDGVNGWLVASTSQPMTDNTDGLVESAIFNVDDLSAKILHICDHRDETWNIIKNTHRNYQQRFSSAKVSNLFREALEKR